MGSAMDTKTQEKGQWNGDIESGKGDHERS